MFASGGLVGCLIFSFGCASVQFEAQNDDRPSISVGPWLQQTITVDETNGVVTTNSECQGFSSSVVDIDATWKTVRAFTIVAAVVGGIVTCDLWLVHWAGIIPMSHWKGVALLASLGLPLLQGWTFLIFRSNACQSSSFLSSNTTTAYPDDCVWDVGSTANVVGMVLWVLTGGVMMVLGPPRLPEHETARQAMEQAQRQEEEDGQTVGSEPPPEALDAEQENNNNNHHHPVLTTEHETEKRDSIPPL